jgi:cob(I)alamin adenosyltransferase
VRPRLISVADDSQLWSEPYEVELTEVFRVQSDIAERVSRALDLALHAPEREALAAAEQLDVSLLALVYLNRLSDLLFILARAANAGSPEPLWRPGGTP